ncbi:hypothetical protein J2X97_000097 [Epilithonimonas hungarica]|jgi:hypothetical protein|nr:hypothetical protein [Epilithonimonas hungarica]
MLYDLNVKLIMIFDIIENIRFVNILRQTQYTLQAQQRFNLADRANFTNCFGDEC